MGCTRLGEGRRRCVPELGTDLINGRRAEYDNGRKSESVNQYDLGVLGEMGALRCRAKGGGSQHKQLSRTHLVTALWVRRRPEREREREREGATDGRVSERVSSAGKTRGGELSRTRAELSQGDDGDRKRRVFTRARASGTRASRSLAPPPLSLRPLVRLGVERTDLSGLKVNDFSDKNARRVSGLDARRGDEVGGSNSPHIGCV